MVFEKRKTASLIQFMRFHVVFDGDVEDSLVNIHEGKGFGVHKA